jgi:subtilase family serine protease
MGSRYWVRGLAPGEHEPIAVPDEPIPGRAYQELGSYTHVTLDPNNQIKESNESNNELSLGKLPDNFVCK